MRPKIQDGCTQTDGANSVFSRRLQRGSATDTLNLNGSNRYLILRSVAEPGCIRSKPTRKDVKKRSNNHPSTLELDSQGRNRLKQKRRDNLLEQKKKKKRRRDSIKRRVVVLGCGRERGLVTLMPFYAAASCWPLVEGGTTSASSPSRRAFLALKSSSALSDFLFSPMDASNSVAANQWPRQLQMLIEPVQLYAYNRLQVCRHWRHFRRCDHFGVRFPSPDWKLLLRPQAKQPLHRRLLQLRDSLLLELLREHRQCLRLL